MDQIKTGKLIRKLRIEKYLTQKQLAAMLHVSDKAVSKWETGNGCPDISLLCALADVLGTDIGVLLSGEQTLQEGENGAMKKMKFYVCKHCGNIITAFSGADVSCCGIRLTPEEPQTPGEQDRLVVEDIGGEWYVSSGHPMTKEHYISMAAYVNDSCAMLFRQYPEWSMQFTLPQYRSGRLLWYCTKCGLYCQDIRRKQI